MVQQRMRLTIDVFSRFRCSPPRIQVVGNSGSGGGNKLKGGGARSANLVYQRYQRGPG